tara:strand:+ start:56966 stop:58720 length:1755 start_codon:yes stop_codon:yes gene_type:complete
LKSNELLSQISDLEIKLNSFSFEELTADEATRIKKHFQKFKNNLELKTSSGFETKEVLDDDEIKKKATKESEALVIARVSHEIRTPLNGIIGFTELLLEDSLSEAQHSNVMAIKSASKTLMTIINELLDYSKTRSGIVNLEAVDFNLHHLVKDVCYLCKTLIVNEEVRFSYSIADTIPTGLLGDPSKLSQILLNLLGNAIKFVDKGTIFLNVEASKIEDDSLVLNFTLKDTGIGIAENCLGTIFDYYQQADANISKKYGGTGLGLGIVKHLLDSLGGDISVSSKVNVGTTFNFSIPYTINTNAQVTPMVSTEQGLVVEEQLKGFSILVFEDNTMNQKLIQNRLQSWGCKSFVTDDVKDGLLLLETKKIDLILMDLQLPETSGFVISKMIRDHKNLKISSIPIIALTADFSILDKKLCEENGINDYVLKPFDAIKLLQKIKNNSTKVPTNMSKNTNALISKINDTVAPDVNLQALFHECMQDTSLLEELIQLFKNNVVEFVGKTKIDLKNSNIEGIRFSTHKLKASLKMMQAHSLYRIVEQMHFICKEEPDFKYLNFLYDCFTKEYPSVESAIEESLEEFKNNTF